MNKKIRDLAQFPQNQKCFDIKVFEALSDEGVIEFQSHFDRFQSIWEREELFIGININYDELLGRVFELPRIMKETKSFEDIAMCARFQFWRLLSNVLSSVRMYIDYMGHQIARDFPETTKQVEKWESTVSSEYDGCFEYRFFYRLRNYCQHMGNPINAGDFSQALNEKKENDTKYSPVIKVSLLDSRFDWPAILKKDFIQIVEVELCTALPNYMSSLRRIHRVVQDMYFDGDSPCINYFDKVRARKPNHDIDVMLFITDNLGDPKFSFQTVPVPEYRLNLIKAIRCI